MNRSDINIKSVTIGEGKSFDESFSLKLDDGLGSYIFVMRITECADSSELGPLVNSINDSFKEQFLEPGVLFDRFEAGVMKVNKVFTELKDEMDFTISAVLIAEANGQIAFTRSGKGEIYLVRNDSFMNVGDAVEINSSSSELFDNVVSGDLKVGDRYILSNTRVLRYASESKIVSESNRFTFNDFSEWLIKKVEFEIDEKVIIDFFECKDIVYKKVKEDISKDFGYYFKSFKRSASFVIRSVLSGDIKAIDLGLRKKIVFAFVSLLVLFVGSSLWMAHRSVVNAEVNRYRDELDVAQLIINNAKSEFDKESIGNMLLNAESKINLARGITQLDDQADDLNQQIRDIKATIDNVITVEPTLVQHVVGPAEVNFSLKSVHSDGDNLYAVTENRLFHYVSGIEKSPITFDPGSGIKDYVWNDDDSELFAITLDGGVIQIANGLSKNLDFEDGELVNGEGVTYYLGQFYILDTENRQIWKQRIGRDSIGVSSPYLVDGYGRFVDSAVDLAIDGYIYVVAEGGDIFRFLRGELDDAFKVESKPMIPMLNPDKILTELDVPYVFVLERSENRIVQFFKSPSRNSLQYVRQYHLPEFSDINDFDINFLDKKIYLIDDRSIYEFDLEEDS